MASALTIGTRGSPLALWQARAVAAALPVAAEVVPIGVAGDWRTGDAEAPLPEDQGGKALFAKEIEQALLARAVDCAVHSAKDLAATLPEGLILAACLPRGEARDVLVGAEPGPGARIGTTSPRRAAFARSLWPGAAVIAVRGNVGTRLDKLDADAVDALILAGAGLARLGFAHRVTRYLSVEEMLPAAGQGAIAVEARADSPHLKMLRGAGCGTTLACLLAERAVVTALGAGCRDAVAAHAVPQGRGLWLRAWWRGRFAEAQGLNPIALGRDVAGRLA
ncbi:MAG: hydroxymethylbilane synthase [Alphaproteobacteria bacterium]|jgi:hydroxymethylbilane synthase|nr:hydroxymethylbilane synthase [Alphaproteobacteria bacterium]